MILSRPALFALALLAGAPVAAQTPPSETPAAADAAPTLDPLDPAVWWADEEPRREARYDPLGGRRANRRVDAARAGFDNGVSPSLYRLWGLQPVQWLTLRRNEAIYEVWYRPTKSTRQAVVRVTLRNDGRAFVQARAGLGCCRPEIDRRVDIDAELPAEARAGLLRLRELPLWNQPRHVAISEAGEVGTASICVDGASYDLTLVEPRRAVHLRRACDHAELGSVAPVTEAVIGAALGRDPRFDDLFTRQDFAVHAAAYQALVDSGGRLTSSAEAFGEAPSAPAESTDAAAEAVADAVAEILAADRAFAARASERTAAEAFREFMAEDGLLFRENGEPIRGRDAIYARFGGAAPERGKLLWEPVEAWASEDGTFGASWGRSRYVPADPAQAQEAYRYLTVWRRDADGRWRGLMDVGVPAKDLLPPAPAPAAPAQNPTPAPAQNPPPASK